MAGGGKSRRELIVERLLAIEEAKGDLLRFATLVRPDPNAPADVARSRYQPAKFHCALALALQRVEQGQIKRLIVNMPPRHGKTELASKLFIPWFIGRNPAKSVIFGTYNEKYALDIGRAVRDVVRHPGFGQVFEDVALKDGAEAADRLETTDSGILAFTGRGGTITGRGGDLIVVDDPIKNDKEARSPAIRDEAWNWWNQTIKSRQMTDDAVMVLIQTRWHEDDIPGRILDPTNDFYDPEEAREWHVLDLPALAADNCPMGRKKGEALWPERFSRDFLLGMQRSDPKGFSALYQGRPSPAGGTFFQDKWIKTYKPHELPKNLRYYAASDHAVSTKQDRDKTCLIVVGIDEHDGIWIVDVWWQHATSDRVVEAMLERMGKFRPLFWWAERSHISKSIGPFLRKRMLETQTFCALVEVVPNADKQTRAQSIQGRMEMGRVHFPERAPWWPEARDELLKFPNAAHDDFVDALAYVGLGLAQQVGAGVARIKTSTVKKGSFREFLGESNRQRRAAVAEASARGW